MVLAMLEMILYMNRCTKSDGTINSLTTSTSVESNSSLSASSHRSVSLLSVLKSPNLSNYSHKGKITKNLPVQGLKRGLVVSKRLIEAHIWLLVNLIRAS